MKTAKPGDKIRIIELDFIDAFYSVRDQIIGQTTICVACEPSYGVPGYDYLIVEPIALSEGGEASCFYACKYEIVEE